MGAAAVLSRIALSLSCVGFQAAGDAAPPARGKQDGPPVRVALNAKQRKAVDDATDRALAWLAGTQSRDGSFPTDPTGQPGVTSLCVLALLARGHLPQHAPYGRQIEAAVDYALASQNRSGLIARIPSGDPATYNHAITGLMLTEVYGMVGREKATRIRPVVERAIVLTCRMQKQRKQARFSVGGWRYVHDGYRSDLSISSWQLMFLRSAKNAGFDVPTDVVEDGLAFVRRCFDPGWNAFIYRHGNERINRGLTGAGILALSLAGSHDTRIARKAGDWLLKHPFDTYNPAKGFAWDRFHYAAFYCSHAMFQLGGKYWERFYPVLAATLLESQGRDGSWEAERVEDEMYGKTYSTALAVLALSPPYQLLPVFQR